ncbi:IclR family transcriptional regulator [Streptomyces caeruleatus]|uniref:IclR family transcriptional regulator n=1 Tax=Streptomyces caeruleatus TaxID=661399 RepID=A0A101U292_9ACTN|nr:IclR family transcriptional regulator [Streptomyces caeruleatus]KUO02634.1 IclR family transcriptional regulator [Streptomyces caeruleatus]
MEHTQPHGGSTDPGDGPPTAVDGNRLVGSDRVIAVLKELARYPGGVGLEELTRVVASPKPTVHRALGALRRPVLDALARRFGETAHCAVLDGREVVYRAKVDPPTGAVRLTSAIGGRNPAHTTAVGKLLLARRLCTVEQVEAWIGGSPLERRTARSLCTAAALHRELTATRERGYGIDDQENETGVNCLALAVYPTSPTVPAGAVSVSALAYRTPLDALVDARDEIRAVLGPLGEPGS